MNLYLKFENFLESSILGMWNEIKSYFPEKPHVPEKSKVIVPKKSKVSKKSIIESLSNVESLSKMSLEELKEKYYRKLEESRPKPLLPPSGPKTLNIIHQNNKTGEGTYYTSSKKKDIIRHIDELGEGTYYTTGSPDPLTAISHSPQMISGTFNPNTFERRYENGKEVIFQGTDMAKYMEELYENRGEDIEKYGDIKRANRILNHLDNFIDD